MQGKSIDTIVSEQGVLIGVLVQSHNEIKTTLKEISDTQRKMEILMERQSTHEEQTRDAVKHIHERLDKHEADVRKDKEVHGEYCDIIEHKADNGDKAYKGLLWIIAGLGGLALQTLYTKIWG